MAELSPERRLALAYAPARARAAWAVMLALDARFAGVVRPIAQGMREPIFAQMRLAWWRERLAQPAAQRPAGEPLLAALAPWQGHEQALIALADGWEALLGEPPLDEAARGVFAQGRGEACAALAALLGAEPGAARRLGQGWALAELGDDRPSTPTRLPRTMRPLVVLHGLAGKEGGGLAAFAKAIRLGIWGS